MAVTVERDEDGRLGFGIAYNDVEISEVEGGLQIVVVPVFDVWPSSEN